MSKKIFIEGGRNNSDAEARRGFSKFFERAGIKSLPRVVICGSRGDAIRDYRNRTGAAVLLIDSEQAFVATTKIQHLLERGDIDDAHQLELLEQDIFFMIEAMESWIIADFESVAKKHLRGNPATAQIARNSVNGRVESIAKATSHKAVTDLLPANWGKGRRMEIVALLDPEIVMKLAPEAEALVNHLKSFGAP